LGRGFGFGTKAGQIEVAGTPTVVWNSPRRRAALGSPERPARSFSGVVAPSSSAQRDRVLLALGDLESVRPLRGRLRQERRIAPRQRVE